MQMTIGELAAAAAAAVSAADVRGASKRVRDLPDERTIRYYATIGLLDRPLAMRGRTALYGERHVLQLVAIKRRQADGRTLGEIQTELVGATDGTLRRIAQVSGPIAVDASEAPVATGRAFWRERPAAPADRHLRSALDLGDGVELLLAGRPTADDIESIRAAAAPLLDLLAQRRLTRGDGS